MNKRRTLTVCTLIPLVAFATAPALTAQTQTTTPETIRVEITTNATPLATETETKRDIRDSLNELETRLITVERRITSVESNVRILGLDVNILNTRIERLETSVNSLEARLEAVEEGVEKMSSNLLRLQTLITNLIELHATDEPS